MKLHHTPLSRFRQELYDDLIFPHHATGKGKTITRREFYDEESAHKKGTKKVSMVLDCDVFSVVRDDIIVKYALTEEMIKSLPIKVLTATKFYEKKTDDVIFVPEEWASWRKTPLKYMDLDKAVSYFIDDHSNPEEYEQYVVTAFSSLICRNAIWWSGCRAFGKSSIYKTQNLVFDHVVVKEGVKSIPAFYRFIPEDGTVILDEMSKSSSEEARENLWYALNIMGDTNEPVLTMNTGGSAQYGTNVPKLLTNTSIVCIMNRVEDYSSPDKFAEYIFSNNQSIDRRFLKLRLNDGALNMSQYLTWDEYTPQMKEKLIHIAKTIEYYKRHYNRTKQEWVCGLDLECDEAFVMDNVRMLLNNGFSETHVSTIRTILKTYYVYCKGDLVKFSAMVVRLKQWHDNYKRALNPDYTGRGVLQ